MSLLQDLYNTVINLAEQFNGMVSNSKTNDELPALEVFDPLAKMRVTVGGTSFITTPQKIIEAAVLASSPYVNRFILVSGYNLTDNVLTVNSGWKWFITGTLYTNSLDSIITIPYAAEGKSRIDLIVATTANDFIRVVGVESFGTPVSPLLPTDALQATFLTVTEGSISDPGEPVLALPGYVGTYPTRDLYFSDLGIRPVVYDGSFAFVNNPDDGVLELAIYGNEGWEFYPLGGGGQNLSQTLINGNTYTDGAGNEIEIQPNLFGAYYKDTGTGDILSGVQFTNSDINFQNDHNGATSIQQNNVNGSYVNELPNASGTFGVSVNGIPFDDDGNVDIDTGGDATGIGMTISGGSISAGNFMPDALATTSGDIESAAKVIAATDVQAGGTVTGSNVLLTNAADIAANAADILTKQPLDSDLTAIAALTTTSFGRSLLTQADAAATRATIGAGTGNGTVTPSGTDTFTNKSISGSTNTFTNIPESAVTNLTTDLAAKENISNKITGTLTTSTTSYPASSLVKSVTDANAANIAMNTSSIAANTAAIALKADIPTAETLATSGTVNLDFSLNTFNKITQSGSITFTGSNTSGTKKIEKTFLIEGSTNAAHTVTFPTTWKNLSGVSCDATKMNFIQISLVNGYIMYSINKYDIPDVTAPSLVKATILLDALNTIELTYSEAIDAAVTPNTSWYTVSGKTVSSVSIVGNRVKIVVSVAFAETDTATLTFTNQVSGNGIQDASGNKAPDFSQSVGLLTYRTDNFNRTNSTTSVNSPSDSGSNWVVAYGAAWGISSNKAYNAGADTTTAQPNAIYLESGQSDVIVRGKITYGATGNASTAFLMRYVDANNYYAVQFGKISSTQLAYSVYRVVGGVGTNIINNTNFGSAYVAGTEMTFMAKFSGSTLSLYNGTTLLTQITDSSVVGTKHGFRTYSGPSSTGNTDRFDDFGIYAD